MIKPSVLNSFPGVAVVIYLPVSILVGYLDGLLFLVVYSTGILDGFVERANEIFLFLRYTLSVICWLAAIVIFYRSFVGNKSLWSSPKVKRAQIAMILGHLGAASIVILMISMKTGSASGLFFLPSMLWSGFWYFLGGATVIAVAISHSRRQPNA